MKVLLTGASSGIGKDMAAILNKKGYDLVLVARSKERLETIKANLQRENPNGKIEIISIDLSIEKNCKELCETVEDVDILINNAGFGDCGNFFETDLEKDMQMIKTNITAYHILTKEYLKKMQLKGKGKILNVASVAGFMPGPLMATYYATKAYVVRLSEAIREELKKEKSDVQISILCPGPVETNFGNAANVKFKLKEADSFKVAEYTIRHFEKGDFYIVPFLTTKLARVAAKIFPSNLVSKVVYQVQKSKLER